MKKFVDQLSMTPLVIADVGSMDVNGSYRQLFNRNGWVYTGLDIRPGPNVDIVLDGDYEWRNIKDDQFDVVVSGSTLEHTKYPWIFMDQIARILKPGGTACIIAPYAWGYHEHPIDCWRIYPEGMKAIMKRSGLQVLKAYMVHDDHNEACGDTIGIARKTA